MGRVRAARRAREREARELVELRELAVIARRAITYIHEIDAPNIKEEFSIINRRNEFADEVHARDARLVARRALRQRWPHPPIIGRGFTPSCPCANCRERQAEHDAARLAGEAA